MRAFCLIHLSPNVWHIVDAKNSYVKIQNKGEHEKVYILAWRIPQTEEPGGLQSTGSQRVGHD